MRAPSPHPPTFPFINFGFAVAFAILLVSPREARAAPWFGWNETKAEDRYADGELDADDLVAPTSVARGPGRLPPTWLSVAAFTHARNDSFYDVGAFVLLGFPLERVAAPRPSQALRPVVADGDARRAARPAAEGTSAPPVTPRLARAAVAAAWRTSGLGVDDAHLDAMAARARFAALLPEARLRAMRTEDQSARVDSLPEEQRTTDSVGANLWLEARLTWRLDRLLYADDEPQMERMRADRQEARARVAGKVLELLFRYQRGVMELRGALAGSPEALEATLRAAEAEVALDVLTGGWFSSWRAEHTADTPSSAGST